MNTTLVSTTNGRLPGESRFMTTRLLILYLTLGLGFAFVAGLLGLVGVWRVRAAALAPQAACVAGPHNGAIAGTQDWCPEDNPHLLTGDVTVPNGMTLTLRAGVVVQGNSGTRIAVNGHLEVEGNTAQPVLLTSAADSAPGQWKGLYFGSGTGLLRGLIIRYAGQDDGWARASIRVNNSRVTIESSQVLSGSFAGQADYGVHLCCGNSSAIISDTLFAGNGDSLDDYAVSANRSNDLLTLVNATFTGNSGYPVQANAAHLPTIYGNTFSGNGLERILVVGDSISQDTRLQVQNGLQAYEVADINSYPYLRVPAGRSLTVDPGVTVMFRNGHHLDVYGVLSAIGNAAQPIIFTSAANSAPGQWAGLFLSQSQADLRYATVRYAGQYNGWGRASINVAYSALNLENSQVRDSQNVGNPDYGVHLCCGGASATILNSTFTNIGDTTADTGVFSANSSDALTITGSTFQGTAGYPIETPAASLARINDNVFSGNAWNRILIHGGDVSAGTSLDAQAGLQSYELVDGALSVPANNTLQVGPGVTFMARNGTYLHVLGFLEAIGTVADPITFTSAADSAPGQWAGIYFQEGNGDLRYVTLRYAGQSIGANPSRGVLIAQNNAGALLNLDHVILRDSASAGVVDNGLLVNGSHVLIRDSLITGIGDASGDYAIYANGGVVTMTNSVVDNNAGVGLYMDSGRASLTCSQFSRQGSHGIWLTGGSAFASLGLAAFGNTGMGLNNVAVLNADARYTWWGDASGPGGVGPGSGDEISANVSYIPWLLRQECVADLSVTKTGPAEPVFPGQVLTYTLAVSNHGPGDATGVVLTDTLPQEVTFLLAQPSQGSCSAAGGIVTCNLGNVSSGQDAAITLAVVSRPVSLCELTNTAVVAGDQADPNLANNIAQVKTTLQACLADMSVVKADTPDPAYPGEILTYTLAVANHGPDPATFVILTDTLPASVTLLTAQASQGACGAADRTVACALGNVASAQSVAVTLTVTVHPEARGVLTNTAVVAAVQVDPNPANNTAQVTTTLQERMADMSVAKADTPDPASPGETLTYTLTVANGGPDPASGVTLTDTLPLTVTLLTAQASQGTCETAAGIVVCALGNVSPGQPVAITLTVNIHVQARGTLTNTAVVAAEQVDPDPTNNTAQAVTTILPPVLKLYLPIIRR